MSIYGAEQGMRMIREATTNAERLTGITIAQEFLKALRKDVLKDVLEDVSGQQQLPFNESAARGATVTVDATGVVQTPADGTISEGDAKRATRRGRGRPRAIDDELPTEAEFDAAVAAAEAAEPDWATV